MSNSLEVKAQLVYKIKKHNMSFAMGLHLAIKVLYLEFMELRTPQWL